MKYTNSFQLILIIFIFLGLFLFVQTSPTIASNGNYRYSFQELKKLPSSNADSCFVIFDRSNGNADIKCSDSTQGWYDTL